MFILHLMSFKWDEEAPFPGYKKLADRMGVSVKMARRYGNHIETKKLIRRVIRVGETNQFDLTPLFDALKAVADAEVSKVRETDEVIPFPSRASAP